MTAILNRRDGRKMKIEKKRKTKRKKEFVIQISYKKFKNKFQRPLRITVKKIRGGVGGFPKILRNLKSGSCQMLTSDYKVGGWGEKRPKICLRNI